MLGDRDVAGRQLLETIGPACALHAPVRQDGLDLPVGVEGETCKAPGQRGQQPPRSRWVAFCGAAKDHMAPTSRARGDGGMPIDTPVFDTTVPALVLKMDSYALHHGGLGVVRSLGRLGIPVYGVYRERLMPAAVSSYLSGRFIWRGEVEDESRFLDGMAMIGERLGRPAVLVPTDDLGAIMVSQHVATLSRWFRFPDPPTGLAPLVASKKGLYELCSKLGIPCPQVSYPSSRHDLEEFAAKAAFPVVAKAIEPWLVPAGAGLKSTSIIHSPEDLLDLYRRLEGNSAGNLLLQEYIPPDRAQDWFFHGYCDARSSCLVSFTGVKLRSYPPYAGATSLGRCQDNDTLRGHAEQLLETIGYRGIMDLDYRLDLRDGEYKLLDFNPRVGAQFRVFEDAAGIDVVRALHLDLTGREVRRRPQREGRVFVVEQSDLLASLGYHRAGDLSLSSWLSSLPASRSELAWFARDDLAPFLLMCVRFLLRGVQRALRLPQGRWRNASTPRSVPARRQQRRP
jgi:D-aspartate ligase